MVHFPSKLKIFPSKSENFPGMRLPNSTFFPCMVRSMENIVAYPASTWSLLSTGSWHTITSLKRLITDEKK